MRRNLEHSLGLGAILLLVLGLQTAVQAQDAGASPPWSIRFSHKPLDVITVPYKDGSATSYYYMLFTLKNEGKQEAPLGLHFKAQVGSNPRKQRTHWALPDQDAEEFVRRISRSPSLKNAQQINRMGTLKPGASVEGIAVLGTFDREWDIAIVTVSGLEPHGLRCRVRKYQGAGFTLAHRAYLRHNRAVLEKAGAAASFTESSSIIKHEVVWVMQYHREGDEYAPHVDPIYLDSQGWNVLEKPAPKVVMDLEMPFKK